MNDQLEMMKRSISDASREPGIQWNKVTWYSWALAGVIFLIAIPGLAFYIGTEYQALQDERAALPPGTACTEEAKICPDGSTVMRLAPSCEFSACPLPGAPATPLPTPGVKRPVAPAPSKQMPVACTMDAKMCADGSAVGRIAPYCEFAKCPSSTGRPELKIVAEVGPTCPVVQVNDAGACADKPFEGSLEVWDQKGGFIKSFKTRINGTYETELTPGTYILQLPKGPAKLPALAPITFMMEQGKLTELLVQLDTGIR